MVLLRPRLQHATRAATVAGLRVRLRAVAAAAEAARATRRRRHRGPVVAATGGEGPVMEPVVVRLVVMVGLVVVMRMETVEV